MPQSKLLFLLYRALNKAFILRELAIQYYNSLSTRVLAISYSYNMKKREICNCKTHIIIVCTKTEFNLLAHAVYRYTQYLSIPSSYIKC